MFAALALNQKKAKNVYKIYQIMIERIIDSYLWAKMRQLHDTCPT